MIGPINFTSIIIGHNMSVSIPKKKGEEKPTGFYQFANFLNDREYYDFNIKKPNNKSVIVDIYNNKTDEQIGSVKISDKILANNPAEAVGMIGQTAWQGRQMGHDYWIEEFEHSVKSDDETAVKNAQYCSDFGDGKYNSGGKKSWRA